MRYEAKASESGSPLTGGLQAPGRVSFRAGPCSTSSCPALLATPKRLRGVRAEGSEVAPGIVFHYTPEGEVTAIDIDSKASKLVDLSLLEVAGLPISATQGSPQESKVG
jgi:hypothetical protein